MTAAISRPKLTYRRQIVEAMTDDARAGHDYLIGLSDGGVISFLRVPAAIRSRVFLGGVFDLGGTVLDRDTDLSPEVILVQTATLVSGKNLHDAENRPPTIPAVMQDPWHRAIKDNLAILHNLINLPADKMGSLAASVLRSTARALMWTSASRAECFTRIGEEASHNLAAIANSKGHTTGKWLAERVSMVRQVIETDGPAADTPEASLGQDIVREVVRLQARGVRPAGAPGGGQAGDGSGAVKSAGGSGPAGNRSGGGAAGTGGGRGGNAPIHPIKDNRIVDGDYQSLVASLREEDWADGDQRGSEFERDGEGEPIGIDDMDNGGFPGFSPDPDEVAAFASIDAGDDAGGPSGKAASATKGPAKQRRAKSTPGMANISFGSKKRRPTGPTMR